MNFLRYYPNQSEDAKIYYSKRIQDEFFLAGHYTKNYGFFSKLDSIGNVIFKKSYYFFDTENNISFRKVINNNDGLVMLGLEEINDSEFEPFIIKINLQGEIVWYFRILDVIVNDKEIFLEEINENLFGVGCFDLRDKGTKLFLFDDKGEIFNQKKIKTNSPETIFKISGLVFQGENVHICGNEIIENNYELLPTGIIITSDLNFKDVRSRYVFFGEETVTITDVNYNQKGLLLTALSRDHEYIPLVIQYDNNFCYIFKNYRDIQTKFIFGSDYFLVDANNKELSKIKYDLGAEWSVNLRLDEFIIDEIFEGNHLLHGNDRRVGFVGVLNSYFESCKTIETVPTSVDIAEIRIQEMECFVENIFHKVYFKEGIEQEILGDEFSEVCNEGNIVGTETTITFNNFTALQTPNFYLQAAGSRGSDSTQGIHLRWNFGGELGKNHLPKGNLASTNVNYNKPEDFVKIFRAPYVKSVFTLDFSLPPQLIDESQKLWVYRFNNNTRIFYIYFKNVSKYTQVRASVDPLTNPLGFMTQYGNELIEIQSSNDLFFACSLTIGNQTPMSGLEVEALSVSENSNILPQHLSYRKKMQFWDLNASYFNIENGKTLRYRPIRCNITSIQFEFYSDFIISTNNARKWMPIGKFSLTMNDTEVFTRLDPKPQSNPVNGVWLRYNDGAFVKTNNYKDKWEHPSQNPLDIDIKTIVQKYVRLSDQQLNPKAFETLNINLVNSVSSSVNLSSSNPQEGQTQISNLDILNVAALDYHVARMLGLGYLDVGAESLGTIGVNEGFVYIAEYYTNSNLNINAVEKNQQLLSMTLPTNIFSERLPLPIKLSQIVPGMGSQNSNLYDINGYSPDGKTRYISLYNESVDNDQTNPVFFSASNSYDASKFTLPIYAGLEYRMVKPGTVDNHIWVKPELSHDTAYLNIDNNNVAESYEVIPIQIPDNNTPLYVHKQKKSGTYFYMSYGINWFSRAQSGQPELSIVTDIKPFNGLLPPSLCSSFLIQKEFPLMFTSQEEQSRFNAIPQGEDKTLTRHTFDYHIYQDGVTYPIPYDSTLPDSVYLSDPNSLFPDNEEIFADDVEIYFRKFVPRTITARVIEDVSTQIINNQQVQVFTPRINHHPNNQLLAIIETKDYPVPSSGFTVDPNNPNNLIYNEIWKAEIPTGSTANDFLGGIFLLDNESYVVNEILPIPDGLKFIVFKKAVSEAMMAGVSNPSFTANQLTLPAYDPSTEGIFNATENMQNPASWGFQNPNSLKVKIGDNNWTVHREIIQNQQTNGTTQKYLEKSRGIWKNAKVEMLFEEMPTYQNSQGTVINYGANHKVHQGVYKVTFPGFHLAQHSQYSSNSNSVEWNKGFVRLFTTEDFNSGNPKESRSIFKVVRTENIGSNDDLVLYIYDENFVIEEDNNTHEPILLIEGQADNEPKPTDPLTGNSLMVNYYPSYKVYLYENTTNNLVESSVLPQGDEDTHYSIFGFRSVDNNTMDMQGNLYKSKFSTPSLMFGSAIIEAQQPEQPTGSLFATRPDKYGKATYSFLTKYTHKPHSIQYFRSDETAFLNALYKPETVKLIKEQLKNLGGENEPYFNNRWHNFLDFTIYTNPNGSGEYTEYPPTGNEKYKFPLPNNKELFDAINKFIVEHNNHFNLNTSSPYYCHAIADAQIGMLKFTEVTIKEIPNQCQKLLFGDFIKDTIQNCFIPLTEIPIIYKHINKLSNGYRPKNLKQNLRDSNGYLLNPTDTTFDMAPMATIYKEPSQNEPTAKHETLFTDFTLDGSSDNFYFYGVREMGTQMKLSEFSPFLGPVRLVNSNPAEPPKIKSLLPVVENKTLGITSKVTIEINPYPVVQKISQLSVYRATNKLDAESVLSMKLIKTVGIADLETEPVSGAWIITDDFEDLDYKPYGDPLFYKIVVSRTVEYTTTDYNTGNPVSQIIIEQAPSLASKTMVTVLVENYNPESPELKYHSEPVTGDTITSVILDWDQTCYKGIYHLYKLSNEGNWKEIAKIAINKKDTSKAQLYLHITSATDPHWEIVNTYDVVNNRLYLPLDDINMNPMYIKDSNGNVLYYHFKVVAENTSNMFSTEEKILTIYKENTWADISGISSDGTDGMNIQGTFIVRPN